MASATKTLTINPAFFQEIKEVDQDLWRSLCVLQRLCLRPAAILSHRKFLLTCLEKTRDQLALHFTLEEAYGYFEDPVSVAPRLCDRAIELRSEHGPLYLRICAMVDGVRDLPYGDASGQSVLAIVDDIAAFHEQFQRHEKAENELIQQEYADDIGVGD